MLFKFVFPVEKYVKWKLVRINRLEKSGENGEAMGIYIVSVKFTIWIVGRNFQWSWE